MASKLLAYDFDKWEVEWYLMGRDGHDDEHPYHANA